MAAINGLAAFIIDPIDQGERLQHLDVNGKPYAKGVPAHNLIGSGSILLGRNTATFEVWDMIRALDYMQSRADILPDRLGVAGNSGGGTQTSYIMALDKRVFVAAPACYLCNLFDNLTHHLEPQDAEQNIFGQIGFGMDHVDYCLMRAPNPTLMCVATQDFFNIDDAWESFRYAKRIFSRWTLAEQMDIIEIDSPHGYGKEFRETTIRWMLRWLANRHEVITEPLNMELLTENEIKSIEARSVLALPNARTTYDINRDLARIYEENRKTLWDKMTSEKAAGILRNVAHIRTLNDIPNACLIPTDIVKSIITKEISDDYFLFQTDRSIFIPVRSNFDLMNQSERSQAVSPVFSDDTKNLSDSSIENNVDEMVSADGNSSVRQLNIIISDKGRYDEKINPFFTQTSQNNESQNPVAQSVAIDLRGWGETQGKGQSYYNYDFFGPDGSEYYLAYLLGTSYIGMRTDDLISIARFFKEKYQCQIHLAAFGLAGNIALHAKIVQPELFESITIEKDALTTWTSLVNESPTQIPLSNVIHGVLAFYDINDLINFVHPNFFDESIK
ncbi:MAG: prolyl oligopeptidase family serine peptidase [Planctomycetia bacterium]|nr:prolyl oligopeptidase family serine peptidase [Planctomycetia bacterium]